LNLSDFRSPAPASFIRDDLFVDRVTIVTPREDSPEELVLRIEAFWQSLGSRVVRMAPDAHDAAVAAVSHTPHLVASALAAATPRQHLALAGTGWSDTTRVAAGDADLWQQILLQNRDHVLQTLDHFATILTAAREALAAQDANQLEHLLQTGKQTRDAYTG